ncbi:protein FAR1-RELATED SEQUENCE 5-like [Rutidosis leptorrhynchoides]|uniref:protein FAR1-RELATED SEQUENCE 5-like n=1 Tax=Rutidosis leptorrhynchoides TaxID=125765 RepID=UPI003A98ED10
MRYAKKLFVYHSTVSNIGPTKAYEVYSNMKGSEKNVQGTVIDFRNRKRDLNVFINAIDSQILVNKMEERKKYVPGFSFEYKLEKSQLHSIFLADEVAKCNYKEFSDVISFDATYRTNRYNLKFVPFTGIDNHRRCVTVVVAMIRDETAESYKWLFNCFMKTFGKEPNMIVTDQDKSMAIAIKEVFKTAKHRLCMWHIMRKVPSKIQEANPNIEDKQEKDFKKRFDKIVWNMYIEPTIFEEKWEKLMDDFSLKNDSCFESAMLKQRSKQQSLDVQTIKKNPKLLTLLRIEKHASKVYTNTVFLIIQQEIVAALYKCSLDKMDKEEYTEIFVVKEKLEKRKECSNEGKKNEGSNEEKKDEGSSMEDKREGSNEEKEYFKYKNDNIDEIPEKYIMRRWRRDIIPPELRSRRNRYGNENIDVQNSINEITSVVDDCVELIGQDETMLQVLLEKVKMVKKEVKAQVPKQFKKKDVVIQEMVGVSKPNSLDIQNLPVGRYKGCGKDKRLISGKEKGILESKKRKITCSNCGSHEHNCRGCDKDKR